MRQSFPLLARKIKPKYSPNLQIIADGVLKTDEHLGFDLCFPLCDRSHKEQEERADFKAARRFMGGHPAPLPPPPPIFSLVESKALHTLGKLSVTEPPSA
jgi:hypothetical protein